MIQVRGRGTIYFGGVTLRLLKNLFSSSNMGMSNEE